MKKSCSKILAIFMAMVMILAIIPTFASAKAKITIEGIEVKERIILQKGDTYKLTAAAGANYISCVYYGDNDYSVDVEYDEVTDSATDLFASKEGVSLQLVTNMKRTYDAESDGYDYEFVSDYWLIVVVLPKNHTVADMGEVTDVEFFDWGCNYKDEFYVTTDVYTKDDIGAYYCEYYVAQNDNGVYVNEDGYAYAWDAGTSNVNGYVIDAQGNVYSGNFDITSTYSFGQWLIRIFLFGWLWY